MIFTGGELRMKRLLEILLLPREVFAKITDKKPMLYIGIVLVGCIDFIFPYLVENYQKFFVNRPFQLVYYNISLAVVFILLLGLVDLMFFSLPLFDLFKVFKKEGEAVYGNGTLIKLMKVYIVAHLPVIPVDILVYALLRGAGGIDNTGIAILLYAYILIVPLWFSAIISRGINVLYDFQPVFKRLVILAVYSWTYLLGTVAFPFMINNWILGLFK